MSARIEEYALIGDCETAALVSRSGSIDWLCWPRSDSGACFAALLGNSEHGRWLIAPACGTVQVTRSYHEGTLVLETRFETPEGEVALVDFMPLRGSTSADLTLSSALSCKLTAARRWTRALMLPLVGFLSPSAPRVASTVNAVERHLMVDGLVRRYDTHATRDGLPPGEGAFLACSFWLADNFGLLGRRADARALFERLLAVRNDVGLLSEQYDPRARR